MAVCLVLGLTPGTLYAQTANDESEEAQDACTAESDTNASAMVTAARESESAVETNDEIDVASESGDADTASKTTAEKAREDEEDPVVTSSEKQSSSDKADETAAGLTESAAASKLDGTDKAAETEQQTALTETTMDIKASDGASITLSGLMPQGATATADAVDIELDNITVLAAYDITIFDAEGNVFEPGDDAIHVCIDNDAIHKAIKKECDLSVYHLSTKKSDPEKIATTKTEHGAVAFDAEHFSIYVVGEGEDLYELDSETPHYTYTLNFYLGDTDDAVLLSTQTVSPGEKVERPSVPDQEHYEFVGWFSEPNGAGEKYDFSDGVMPDITDEQNHEIDLYAHYGQLYYVHFMTHAHEQGDEDTKVVFHTETYLANDSLDVSAAEALYLAEGYLSYIDSTTGAAVTLQAVTGWKDADGKEWKSGDAITDDLELYPIVEGAYWIYFDMNSQHSTEDPAPEYVLATEATVGALPNPSVPGYRFKGWFTEAEGGDLVTDASTLSSLPQNDDGSITLYAQWVEAEVAYTINIWRQKAIDGEEGVTSKEVQSNETYDDYIRYYDYAESHHVTADQSQLKTGDTPTATTVYNWSTYTGYGTITNASSNYYGFEYGTNTDARNRTLNNLSTITMAADGSTVINIFYNRATITWTFNRGTGNTGATTGTLVGLFDTNVAPTNGDGAGTLSDWPSAGNNYIWIHSSSRTPYTFETKFLIISNALSATFTPYSFPNANKPVYYYLEVTNEATQVDTGGEKAQEASRYGISYTKTVEGTPYVFAKRLMVQSSLTIESKFIGYEYAGYNVTDSGTTFTGKGSSIPTNANQCFLFNDANKLSITLLSDSKVVGVNDAGQAVTTSKETTYTVKYGEDLSNYVFPATLDGATWGPAYYYTFSGTWYEDPTLTAPFTAITMPNNNLVAYANWELRDITVTFKTGVSDVEAPADQHIKATEVALDPGTLEREGYTHVGWVDENGKVFNFKTILYADTQLTAIWKADDESGYQMKYDLNAKNSWGLLDTYTGDTTATNAEHFAAGDYEDLWTIEHAFKDLHSQVYSRFICWNTAADGTGTAYYPGDELYVDGDTTLYAIWSHENNSTLVLVHNYPAGYSEGTSDNIITQNNLTEINVAEESGLNYHQEITVGEGKNAHTYRFDGWSTDNPGTDPTDKDVDIAADASVKVDTLGTGESHTNYLYAVWIEVHQIMLTKEIVNNAVNCEIPKGTTFDFTWSVVTGDGETVTNENELALADKESFIIPDVASGETVTITEQPAVGFIPSYNGAHSNVTDDGAGTYTFTMDANSMDITATNTVETTEITGVKQWNDNDNEDGLRPESITINLMSNDRAVTDSSGNAVTTTASAKNWEFSFKNLARYSSDGSEIEYALTEDDVVGYKLADIKKTEDDQTCVFEIINELDPDYEPVIPDPHVPDPQEPDSDNPAVDVDDTDTKVTGGVIDGNSGGIASGIAFAKVSNMSAKASASFMAAPVSANTSGSDKSATGAQTGDTTSVVALLGVIVVAAFALTSACVRVHRSRERRVHRR